MKNAVFKIGISFFLYCLLMGCVTVAMLSPANTARLLDNKNIALDELSGIRLLVISGTWNATPDIRTKVTPVRIRIENNSGKDVRFRVSDFHLVDSLGENYAALPLYAIEGTIQEPVLIMGYAPIPAPSFYYQGFFIAPYYSPIYSGIPPFDGPFFYDFPYYQQTYTYWKLVQLPTPEIYARALPDGILKDGGTLEGYLYFAKVSPIKTRHVNLIGSFYDKKGETSIGPLTIPLKVAKSW